MYLMRELLGMQLVEIGSAFGGRDHSTVIHSLERVAAMMKEDPTFAQRVAKIQAALESSAELNMIPAILHSVVVDARTCGGQAISGQLRLAHTSHPQSRL